MVNCVCADKDSKSREVTVTMLKKISGLHIHGAYAGLGTALSTCEKHCIHLLFVHLDDLPIPKKDILVLQKMKELGVQIILLSEHIGVAGQTRELNAADFIMLPTTTRRLWKGCINALQVILKGAEIPVTKSGSLDDILLSA